MGLWILAVQAAFPCAGIVHADGVLAESDAAEVLFTVRADGDTTVSYAVTWTGDAADFGWLVPIPGAYVALADGDAATFDDLRERTAPLVTVEAEDTGSAGCCAGAAKGGDNALRGGDSTFGTIVVAEGFTGTYDFAVLDPGSDPAALATWLTDNGWEIGTAQPDVDHYVALGHLIVALEIAPDAGDGELPPIDITYAGDELRFPSVMAQHATVETQRTTVYVIADDRATLTAGWTESPVDSIFGFVGTDAGELFDATLETLGAEGSFGVTFAGGYDGRFVTRFDTLAPSSAHTDDAIFAPGAGTDEAHTQITLGETAPASAWVLPLLALFPLRARRRRRTGPGSRRG